MNSLLNKFYIPNLPIFKAIEKLLLKNGKLDLSEICFVCTQHELAATINLVESLVQLGANPSYIYLLGKYYSTCNDVADKLLELGIQRQLPSVPTQLGDFSTSFKADIEQMWEQCAKTIKNNHISNIVILDDGGRCLAGVPKEMYGKHTIVGIEQTTGGIVNPDIQNLPFPIIEVASSAAKLWLESPIIASAAITEKIDTLMSAFKEKTVCGVIGTGYIGMAVIKKLLSLGYKVIGYDKNKDKSWQFSNFKWGRDVKNVIKAADFIFGCTGYDITDSINIDQIINNDKHFFSCSSEDKDFFSLLKLIQEQSPFCTPKNLGNVVFMAKNGYKATVWRSGFPITFDNGPQPAPANDIQLTQGLLLCSLIQAVTLLPDTAINCSRSRVMLDPFIQQFIAKEWSLTQIVDNYLKEMLQRFHDFHWILSHSGGAYTENVHIKHFFR